MQNVPSERLVTTADRRAFSRYRDVVDVARLTRFTTMARATTTKP